MSTFPVLKTGAVMQYPAEKELVNSTEVLWFVDGSEQRIREYRGSRRRWIIRLELLDESEMAAIEEFFVSQHGRAGSFQFRDPWDGTEYPDCGFASDELPLEQEEEGRGRAVLVVQDNGG